MTYLVLVMCSISYLCMKVNLNLMEEPFVTKLGLKPLKILAPVESLLASLTRMLALLTRNCALLTSISFLV